MPITWPWSKQFPVRCPDGTTQFVFRNIDHAFPFYFKQAKVSAAAALDGLEKIKGKLDARYESQIKSILFGLDDKNASMQAHLRAAYVLYASAPCKKLDYLQAAIESIMADERDLRAAELAIKQLMAVLSNHAKGPLSPDLLVEVSHQLIEVVKVINRSSSANALANKMKAVAQNSEEWRRP
jgi:hypothetical protein